MVPQTFNYYDTIDFWQFEDLRTYNNLTPIDLASSFEVWTFGQFSIEFSFAVLFYRLPCLTIPVY
ncbi:MAG: hypothetical protein ACTS45_00450 [Candidatus Hodgkinia cicadicola]